MVKNANVWAVKTITLGLMTIAVYPWILYNVLGNDLWDGLCKAWFPGHSHLQVLVTCSMQNYGIKHWQWEWSGMRLTFTHNGLTESLFSIMETGLKFGSSRFCLCCANHGRGGFLGGPTLELLPWCLRSLSAGLILELVWSPLFNEPDKLSSLFDLLRERLRASVGRSGRSGALRRFWSGIEFPAKSPLRLLRIFGGCIFSDCGSGGGRWEVLVCGEGVGVGIRVGVGEEEEGRMGWLR